MDRSRWFALCALTASSYACSEDLRCYEGAREVNGVCECIAGTEYVRASGSCEPSLGSDTGNVADGGAGGDARAPVTDAQPAPTPRDGGGPSDAGDGEVCENDGLRCEGACIDPRSDGANCGDCGVSCRGGATCEEGVCSEAGCSDGTREAFVDRKRFATVAGCAAYWPRGSLRAARQIGSCGNSLGDCRAPVDACAPGWHVCGGVAAGPTDVTARVTQAECGAQPGRFAMALGDHSCTDCGEGSSGAACCGSGCLQQMGDCLWPKATAWFGALAGHINRCSEIESLTRSATVGVMCCRDR